jgi:hypothetical protein
MACWRKWDSSGRQRSVNVTMLECDRHINFFPFARFPTPPLECRDCAVIERSKSGRFYHSGFGYQTCFQIQYESNYAASLVPMHPFFNRIFWSDGFNPVIQPRWDSGILAALMTNAFSINGGGAMAIRLKGCPSSLCVQGQRKE